MKSRHGGCYGEFSTWKWREIPSRNPIGGGPVPIPAREPVGSVEGAISRGNGWANPNGELKNGVDIWRGWKCERKVCNKKKKKEKK